MQSLQHATSVNISASAVNLQQHKYSITECSLAAKYTNCPSSGLSADYCFVFLFCYMSLVDGM
jgi:hypothetical protein